MITHRSIGYQGRLGNQMLQYASIIGIAKKYNYDYCFHNNHVLNSENGNENSYVVDIPEPDTDFDTNNNNNDGNSNIILNVDPGVESSPTGSQFGNM